MSEIDEVEVWRRYAELKMRIQQLEDGLESAIDKIAGDIASVQAQITRLEKRQRDSSKRPELRDVMPDYEKYLERASRTTLFGFPVAELSQDDLAACAAYAAEELSKSWRFTGLNHGN